MEVPLIDASVSGVLGSPSRCERVADESQRCDGVVL
jgi:hypothetical protein